MYTYYHAYYHIIILSYYHTFGRFLELLLSFALPHLLLLLSLLPSSCSLILLGLVVVHFLLLILVFFLLSLAILLVLIPVFLLTIFATISSPRNFGAFFTSKKFLRVLKLETAWIATTVSQLHLHVGKLAHKVVLNLGG